MKKQLFIKILLPIMLFMGLVSTSCNDLDKGGIYYDRYTEFATLEAVSSTTCVFSIFNPNTEAWVSLVSTGSYDVSTFTVGERYVIIYSNEENERYRQGDINLLACVKIENGSVIESTLSDIDPMTTDELNTIFAGLTGKYLNVYCQAYYMTTYNVFGVYVDESTLSDEMPDVYLCYSCSAQNQDTPKVLYGSFDISKILSLPTARGFNLHCVIGGSLEVLEFLSQKADIVPGN